MTTTTRPRRQTTVLFGGSNGTATLISLLCDRSDPANAGHVVRVVTRNPSRFIDQKRGGAPLEWRCHEQRPVSDLVPATLLPSSWSTHVGAPHSVFGYDDDGDDSSGGYGPIERAISGIDCPDDGGVADCIVLACPVNAHLPILRRVARALYRLDADRALLSSPRGAVANGVAPLFIGSLYGAGGFDWMCRIAFGAERPAGFSGHWNRGLALWGLRAFPFLCKSLERGTVTLYGRFPQLVCVVSPSNAAVRVHLRRVLGRVLQIGDKATRGKTLSFIGLSSAAREGGDGTGVVDQRWNDIARDNSAAVEAGRDVQALALQAAASATASSAPLGAKKGAADARSHTYTHIPPVPAPRHNAPDRSQAAGSGVQNLPPDFFTALSSPIMADEADPYASLGFLSCTLNATNQILHPCIMAALFDGPDGSIPPWTGKKTKLPRFYADGAARPEAGRLIVAIAVGELYPLMTVLDSALSPNGLLPISAQHGGEPVGRVVLTEVGNHPVKVTERSGMLREFWERQQWLAEEGGDAAAAFAAGAASTAADDGGKGRRDPIRFRGFFEWGMSYGLSHNSRLASVLAPCVVDEKTGRIKPNVNTRFFVDDVPHGLCVVLGLGELLGFDLERDMPETLGLVRKLQGWMGREYVRPAAGGGGDDIRRRGGGGGGGGEIVGGSRDLHLTSAPQAFGVTCLDDLRDFMRQSPFGDDVRTRVQARLRESRLMTETLGGGGGGDAVASSATASGGGSSKNTTEQVKTPVARSRL